MSHAPKPEAGSAGTPQAKLPHPLRTPTFGFLAVIIGVLAGEYLLMLEIVPLEAMSTQAKATVDALAIVTILIPLLQFLFAGPMTRSLRAKEAAERALQAMVGSLEASVAARTAELESSNQSLRKEVENHARTAARLELQGQLLDAVQQPVIATGKGGAIIYWNRFAGYQFGWTEEEIKGKTLSELTSFSSEASAFGLSSPKARHGWSGEVQARRRDGSSFPAHLTYSPMERPDGTLAGFVYSFVDLSDRKEAELALRRSEEKYQTLVESSPTGIFILGAGEVVYGNRRFFEIIDLSPDSPLEVRPQHIVHPHDWVGIQRQWEQRMAGQPVPHEFECRIVTPSGKVRWVLGKSTLIPLQKKSALLVNIQDITERQEALQALRASQEALHALSAQLIQVQENERQRVARELHDSIGSTLSAIKLTIHRSLDAPCPEGRDCHVGSLRSVVPVIQNAIEEVRRIAMALRPLTLDDLGLVATIGWLLREFQAAHPEVRVESRVEVEEAGVPESLKVNIFRILQEGLNNTSKYSGARRVGVGLRAEEGQLILELEDDGVGFDPGTLSRPDRKGGLGLASMRERAELSHGELSILAAPGRGSRIRARWRLAATS